MTTGSWEDLRYFLVAARTGSASAAARELGVNHATVSRRLTRLEEHLAVRLFERSRAGLVLTAPGTDILALAEHAEDTLLEVERRALGRDARLSGPLRVTLVDTLAVALAAALREFAGQHPRIALDLTTDMTLRDLDRREADVALRVVSGSPPQHLVGRRLAAVAYAGYARVGAGVSARWLVWGNAEAQGQMERWLARARPEAMVAGRVGSGLVAVRLAAEGMGAALLPCLLGDAEPTLARLGPPERALQMHLWVLTHPDLRRTARVRAFLDHVSAAVAPLTAALAGEVAAVEPAAADPG